MKIGSSACSGLTICAILLLLTLLHIFSLEISKNKCLEGDTLMMRSVA